MSVSGRRNEIVSGKESDMVDQERKKRKIEGQCEEVKHG